MDHSLFSCERKIARFRNDKKTSLQLKVQRIKFGLNLHCLYCDDNHKVWFSKGITVTFSTVNAKISFSSVLTEVIKIAIFSQLNQTVRICQSENNNFRTREHFIFHLSNTVLFYGQNNQFSRNFDTGLTSILTPNVGNQDLHIIGMTTTISAII